MKSTRVKDKIVSTYVPCPIPFSCAKAIDHASILRASMQMFVKLVNLEGIFNFKFGTGKDETRR